MLKKAAAIGYTHISKCSTRNILQAKLCVCMSEIFLVENRLEFSLWSGTKGAWIMTEEDARSPILTYPEKIMKFSKDLHTHTCINAYLCIACWCAVHMYRYAYGKMYILYSLFYSIFGGLMIFRETINALWRGKTTHTLRLLLYERGRYNTVVSFVRLLFFSVFIRGW